MSMMDGVCWAIKTPRYLLEPTTRYTRTQCITDFRKSWNLSWRTLKRKYGFSCVKVKVVEVPSQEA
jgi:hypothetical protein